MFITDFVIQRVIKELDKNLSILYIRRISNIFVTIDRICKKKETLIINLSFLEYCLLKQIQIKQINGSRVVENHFVNYQSS